MTVEKELRRCLLEYPGIYPNKWSVYNQWFAVNGNGYRWLGGQLIQSTECDDDIDTAIDIKDIILHKINYHLSDSKIQSVLHSDNSMELAKRQFNRIKQRLHDKVSLILDVDNRMVDFTPTEGGLYTLCKYSKICNLPDDIQPDWLSAATEFYNYIMSVFDTLSINEQVIIKKIKIK